MAFETITGGGDTSTFRAMWSLPAVADAPGPRRRDAWLVGVGSTVALLEGVFRPDVAWRPVALVVALTVIGALPWRRIHPLAVTTWAFGVTTSTTVAFALFGPELPPDESFGLFSTALLLIIPYALFRWGSGRHAAIGLALLLSTWLVSVLLTENKVGDAIGGLAVLVLPMVAGELVRARRSIRTERAARARASEREVIARELHDVVAHHMSAVVIQAQAGQTVAATRPEAAVEALVVIEEAAARSLEELRSMVRSLRALDGDEIDAPLRPNAGLDDLSLVTEPLPDHITAHVRVDGPVAAVSDTIAGALHRIAQESVTNIIRHGADVGRVDIRVDIQAPHPSPVAWLGDTQLADMPRVVLEVTDDGHPPSSPPRDGGFGVTGMRERTTILGGVLTAGPMPRRGWAVRCAIPLREPT